MDGQAAASGRRGDAMMLECRGNNVFSLTAATAACVMGTPLPPLLQALPSSVRADDATCAAAQPQLYSPVRPLA
eukprot:CAMPEP_0168437084 /NCGR_PEP_ID=MMETSP0228-20121227/41253_1 /TAXON_ID=133427 /ORGANISM="Protoceratium reticulatum, Strain CCCM 535 (=CCMP 1889)" /LENGTH=73 /DNA_ID=CAMNT_0008451289 /DNA_START=248 /DNA_END=467 /DNA_ORIENTATION=+